MGKLIINYMNENSNSTWENVAMDMALNPDTTFTISLPDYAVEKFIKDKYFMATTQIEEDWRVDVNTQNVIECLMMLLFKGEVDYRKIELYVNNKKTPPVYNSMGWDKETYEYCSWAQRWASEALKESLLECRLKNTDNKWLE